MAKVQKPSNDELYTIVRTISSLHDSEPRDFITGGEFRS
jgi:hypothetical protein